MFLSVLGTTKVDRIISVGTIIVSVVSAILNEKSLERKVNKAVAKKLNEKES